MKRKAIATKKKKRKNNCNGGTNGRACVVCFFSSLAFFERISCNFTSYRIYFGWVRWYINADWRSCVRSQQQH